MKVKLRELLKSNQIEDIFVLGFVDNDSEVTEFYQDMRYLYFMIENRYIEIECIEQSSKIKIMITDNIVHKFEIDEDMKKAKTSMSEIIFVDILANNSVREFLLYNITMVTVDYIVCDAIQINLNSRQKIFLDPTFYYGIGVGGIEQKEWWKESLNGKSIVCEDIMKS